MKSFIIISALEVKTYSLKNASNETVNFSISWHDLKSLSGHIVSKKYKIIVHQPNSKVGLFQPKLFVFHVVQARDQKEAFEIGVRENSKIAGLLSIHLRSGFLLDNTQIGCVDISRLGSNEISRFNLTLTEKGDFNEVMFVKSMSGGAADVVLRKVRYLFQMRIFKTLMM